jgi:hypothetical protein
MLTIVLWALVVVFGVMWWMRRASRVKSRKTQ